MPTRLPFKRVAVAMSGGLDSSVVAALLTEQGVEVVGITAHMWKEGSRCCSMEDVQRAQKVAWHLGIKHFVLNAETDFRQYVVDPFVQAYIDGITPSPCVICNQRIKFGFLLTRARQFDCDGLATGHYARIDHDGDHYRLLKAADGNKDQSYFLHRLSQQQLAHTLFPLDSWNKTDSREYARARKLPIEGRGESQDICFVTDGQCGDFIEAQGGPSRGKGNIVNSRGEVVAKHPGIHRFTIGQRRGLGIATGQPVYVTRIDAETNTITVGPRDEAMGQSCVMSGVHWISGSPPTPDKDYDVRIRYRHDAARARVEDSGDGRFNIAFHEPQFGITPGQAAVIYDDSEVLGGGWIQRRDHSAPEATDAIDS